MPAESLRTCFLEFGTSVEVSQADLACLCLNAFAVRFRSVSDEQRDFFRPSPVEELGSSGKTCARHLYGETCARQSSHGT